MLLIGFLVALAYVIGGTAYYAATTQDVVPSLLLNRSFDMVFVAWMLYVGGAIGSFLNVVAHRMPLGRSINGRSHCPYCDVQIPARDNIPVLGWLHIRGRCSNCRLPISYRYPLVELVVALSLFIVGWKELYGTLSNLPYELVPRHYTGAIQIFNLNQQTLLISLFHIVGIANLFAIGLIAWDRAPQPWSLRLFAMLTTILPPLAWPRLASVPASFTIGVNWHPFQQTRLESAIYVAVALLVAFLIATIIGATQRHRSLRSGELIVPLAIAATMLGWQCFLFVIAIAMILSTIVARAGRFLIGRSLPDDAHPSRPTPAMSLLVALAVVTSLVIACWYPLHQQPWFPTPRPTFSPYPLAITAALTTFGLVLLAIWQDRTAVLQPATGVSPLDGHDSELQAP
jgi:leader peptidase (prepilin peptidase) / N-methyltransferase